MEASVEMLRSPTEMFEHCLQNSEHQQHLGRTSESSSPIHQRIVAVVVVELEAVPSEPVGSSSAPTEAEHVASPP